MRRTFGRGIGAAAARTLGAICAVVLVGSGALLEGSVPAASSQTVAAAPIRNPIFAAADPHLTIAGGRYWLYATTPGELGDEKTPPRLYAWTSPDLREWGRTRPIFSFEGVDWIDDDGAARHFLWAPALAEAGGRYFLYYSVGPQNPTPSRLGVAVGDTPAGPFKDSGKPLLTGGKGFEAIDPAVFVDPKTGTAYLYVGGSAGAKLRVFELDPTMVEFKREVRIDQPPKFTEGPFMHERNGVYYLSYSNGRWYDATYSAHYATAPGPLGPWTYRGVLLRSDATHKGPGHHSIVQNPTSKEWFIAYHRWDRIGPGPFDGDRNIAVQRLTYAPDGSIPRIRMDDAPPPASPIGDALAVCQLPRDVRAVRSSSRLRAPAVPSC